MKRIESNLTTLATSVLMDFRRRDGLTCYAHADNCAKDIRHMTEALREQLPLFLDRIGALAYLESLGEE